MKCSEQRLTPADIQSTHLERPTTTYVVETTPTDVPTENGLISQNKVLMMVSGVIILVLLLVIIILAYNMIKRRSNEQNDRNQTVNATEGQNATTGLQITAPVYVNVTNQSQEPVPKYELVNMRLISQPDPEYSSYTHLTPNENRDTYLEPINTQRGSSENELNTLYEIID